MISRYPRYPSLKLLLYTHFPSPPLTLFFHHRHIHSLSPFAYLHFPLITTPVYPCYPSLSGSSLHISPLCLQPPPPTTTNTILPTSVSSSCHPLPLYAIPFPSPLFTLTFHHRPSSPSSIFSVYLPITSHTPSLLFNSHSPGLLSPLPHSLSLSLYQYLPLLSFSHDHDHHPAPLMSASTGSSEK